MRVKRFAAALVAACALAPGPAAAEAAAAALEVIDVPGDDEDLAVPLGSGSAFDDIL